MQEMNDQNVEDTTIDAQATPSKEIESASRKSNLRSRYALKSNSSGTSAPIENIGEIKLSPGEFLKDDLTENAGSAKLKAGNREGDTRSKGRSQDSESQEFGKERRSEGENHERREQRRRGGKEGRHNRNRDVDAPQSKGKKDDGQRRSRDVKREPRHRGSREKTHGESQGNQSMRRKTHRREKADETEPATWNAMDVETDGGFFKKAGRFLSSLFGGQKDEGKEVASEPSRNREHRSKGRRRRSRSRNSSRGRHGGGKPRT